MSLVMVWGDLVHDYDEDRQCFGDRLPLAERVSNELLLRRP